MQSFTTYLPMYPLLRPTQLIRASCFWVSGVADGVQLITPVAFEATMLADN